MFTWLRSSTVDDRRKDSYPYKYIQTASGECYSGRIVYIRLMDFCQHRVRSDEGS